MRPNVDVHFIGESTSAQSSGIMVEFKNGLSLPSGSLKSRLERPLNYSRLDKYNFVCWFHLLEEKNKDVIDVNELRCPSLTQGSRWLLLATGS